MICKYCGKPIKIPTPALLNAEIYRNRYYVLSISECCGHAYRIATHIEYTFIPYTGSRDEDDWGNEIKK